MSSENVFEEVAKYANPTRRTFLLGLLGAAITAPAVVSFFGRSGQALGTQSVSASGGLSEWTGWYDTRYFFDPSANWPADPSANFMCNISANFPYYSANPIRNPSGNFYTDQSGNYNYFEMIYYDASETITSSMTSLATLITNQVQTGCVILPGNSSITRQATGLPYQLRNLGILQRRQQHPQQLLLQQRPQQHRSSQQNQQRARPLRNSLKHDERVTSVACSGHDREK